MSRRLGHDVRMSQARMFDEAGLPHAKRDHVPNSRAALNVAELARGQGVHDGLHQRLMTAHWAEDRDIGDVQVLVDEAASFGLDPDEVRDVATTSRYQDRVEASTRAVIEMGAGGVPAWVIDDRLLIPGAQPHELFERVMEKLGYPDDPVDNVP